MKIQFINAASLTLIVFAIVAGYTLLKEKGMEECTVPIVDWLKVFAGIQFVSAMTDIAKLIVVITFSRPMGKLQLLNAFYVVLVLTSLIGWLIYGNTFFHTQAAEDCYSLNENAAHLYKFMAYILIYGDFLFVLYGLFLMCCIPFSCMYLLGSGGVQNSRIVDTIPYLNAVKSLKRLKYEEKENKMLDSCVICMIDFKDSDEVAELKCDKRHYFHSHCVEEWLKRKLECPLCKKEVTGGDY